VLALAARHLAGPLDCFTVAFEGGPYNEAEVAAEMAGRAGAVLHPVRVTQQDLVEHLSDAVYHGEGLAINGHLSAKYLLSRAIQRAGFKVALTGEGADEVVAGYPHLRQDAFLADADGATAERLARLRAGNALGAGIFLAHGEALPLDAVRGTLGFVPGFLEAKATLGRRLHAILADDFRAGFAGRDAFRTLLNTIDVRGQLAGRHRVDQSLYLWSKLALVNYILRTLGDGVEMAHAVEGRLPFLDHQLFEFARRLPLALKIRGTVEKYVLREAVRGLVTDTVYRRQKHPFLAPPVSRFSTARVDEFVADVLRGGEFAAVPFFDRARVLALVERLPALDATERSATDPVLMMALTACFLQRRFNL
jgi:asparagine synthase (glutamine-hydrolysing)